LSYTITLSGRSDAASQAETALSREGFTVIDDYRHGLPPMATGVEPTEPQAFVTVCGEDINAAHDAVKDYGWVLRSHHKTAECESQGVSFPFAFPMSFN
jgi:hypothetical protein